MTSRGFREGNVTAVLSWRDDEPGVEARIMVAGRVVDSKCFANRELAESWARVVVGIMIRAGDQ